VIRNLVALVVMITVVASVPSRAQQVPPGAALVEKAAQYFEDTLPLLTNIVAEEQYVQDTSIPRNRRTLISDYLIVRLANNTDLRHSVTCSPLMENPCGIVTSDCNTCFSRANRRTASWCKLPG
jgi:hypothetical protein